MTDTHDSPLEPGSILVGKFQITGVLGRGGFGVTYEGFDLKLKRRVAIKELFPDGAMRQGSEVIGSKTLGLDYLRTRFVEEAQALAKFDSRGIVRVFETFEDNGTAYMIMEYLEGQNLEQVCQTYGPLQPDRVKTIILELCDALELVHQQGMLHRDVKPSNVFLTPGRPAVLIDFGSARELQLGTVRAQTQMVSHGYAAPEQYANASRLGPETDIYALGATAWFALTATVPPSTMDRAASIPLLPVETITPNVPTELAQFVDLATRMDRQQRPKNVTAVQTLLHNPKTPPKQQPRPNPQPAKPPAPTPSSTKTVQVNTQQNFPPKPRQTNKNKIYAISGTAIALTLATYTITNITKNPPNTTTLETEAAADSTIAATTPAPPETISPIPSTDPTTTVQPTTTTPTTTTQPPIAPLRILLVSSFPKSITTQRNAIRLAIAENKAALAEARIELSVAVGDSAEIASPDVAAVFSAGGSAAASERLPTVASATKAFVVLDGTADTLTGKAFRPIATDSEQAAAAAKAAKDAGRTTALILADSSAVSSARVGGFKTAFPTANVVTLDGSNSAAAIDAWTPGAAVFIASTDMKLVAPILKSAAATKADRWTAGVNGLFDLPIGSYLNGVMAFTSLAPDAEDAALTKKMRAYRLGSSDGEQALYAYEGATATIKALLKGLRDGPAIQSEMEKLDPTPRTRVFVYKSGAWR